MRELKFRAWDKIHEKYREPMVYDIFHEKIVVRLPIETLKKGEFLLEQYTGLKDKNGKEIYEGDIIQEEIDFNSTMTDGTFKYMVYWDEEELCWGLEHIGNESIHNKLWQCNSSTEVIGNIHENPELLEGKL